MRLAYVEHCLPGSTIEERLQLAWEHGLALELANRGGLDPGPILRAGFEVVTLQAYRMHQFHPLHRHAVRRKMAMSHVQETIETAARYGIPRVVTACGFGEDLLDRPFERCLEFFSQLAPLARDNGVRILIEPLSPLKAAALAGPHDIRSLMDELDQPDVFSTILDTGHLLDGGHDPTGIIAKWPRRVEELQVRGPRSTAPVPGAALRQWVGAPKRPPAVICVEHGEPITREALADLVTHLREEAGIP